MIDKLRPQTMSQAWLIEVVLDRTFLPVFLTRPWEKESQTFRWPFPWISSPRRRSFPCTHHTRYWTHTRETTLPPVEGWQGKLWLQTRDRHYLHFRKGAKECCSCRGHREENPKYLDNSRYIESVKKKIIKRVEPSSLAKSSPSLSAKSAPVKKNQWKPKLMLARRVELWEWGTPNAIRSIFDFTNLFLLARRTSRKKKGLSTLCLPPLEQYLPNYIKYPLIIWIL